MPVVINEFEVVPEQTARPAPSAPAPTPPAPDAAGIERLLSIQRARDERVRAY